MGTSIALHLAKHCDPLRAPVVLFERHELGSGSSGRSGAILRQMYAQRDVAAMARDSLREYGSFETRNGRSIGFRRTGVLTLAGPDSADWAERLAENVAMMRDIGIDAKMVDTAGIRELVPGIAVVEGTIGAWERGGGVVDPQMTVDAFAALARTYGVVTRLATAVERLVVEGGRVTGVETSEGVCTADAVIVAGGAWTRGLLAAAGVDLPLTIVRPENHFLAMPGGEEDVNEPEGGGVDLEDPLERLDEQLRGIDLSSETTAHPVLIDLEYGFYSRCEPRRARTRIGFVHHDGAALLEDPDALDEEVSSAAKKELSTGLRRRLPVYRELPDAGSQAAWYTLSPDHQAAIGPLAELPGAFVVAGFSGHGFKLAPSVGLGVAQMVVGQPVSAFEPAFFAPDRFAAGAVAGADRPARAFGL